MAKRFIVCLNSGSVEQNDKFKEYIDENGLGWWHWISNSWLLRDHSGRLNSEIIRDKLLEIYPGTRNLVIELQGPSTNDTWHGFGPSGEEKNMFNWLRDTWSKS
jgi:hypothetical protein